MRYFIFLSLFALLSTVVYANHIKENEVPMSVKEYITTNYPEATHIKWDFEKKKNCYEAEFDISGLKYELKITSEGVLISAEINISIETVPDNIQEYLKKNYPNFNIVEAEKIIKGNMFKYEISISGENSKGNKRNKNIYFDSDGNVIKTK